MDEPLYLVKDIRECERKAYSKDIAENDLMLRAAQAAFSVIKDKYPDSQTIAIFCGGGNNGGDGYALARFLFEANYQVYIYQTHAIENLPQPARENALVAFELGISCQSVEDFIDSDVDLIVDALLGIGLESEPSEPLAQVIKLINESSQDVLSLDVPSGLNADTGLVIKEAVKSQVTVTFIGKKPGLYTLDGPDYCGEVVLANLKLDDCLEDIKPYAYLLAQRITEPVLKVRPKNCNKSMFGHVLVIGGNEGMPGSVMLAAKAAMRSGAGAVSLALHPMYAKSAVPNLLEAMVYGINAKDDLDVLLKRASVVVLGPGLGTDDWAQEIFDTTISAQLPLVMDAQALRLLAINPQHDDNWILTPHPGEAHALLNKPVSEIQKNRFQAADEIQRIYGGSVVLKGNGTIINNGNDVFVCQNGNPGMSSAGMGDVLSGIIAGLLAQGLSIAKACEIGVWLHAFCADKAAMKNGERGLIASDLFNFIHRNVNFI